MPVWRDWRLCLSNVKRVTGLFIHGAPPLIRRDRLPCQTRASVPLNPNRRACHGGWFFLHNTLSHIFQYPLKHGIFADKARGVLRHWRLMNQPADIFEPWSAETSRILESPQYVCVCIYIYVHTILCVFKKLKKICLYVHIYTYIYMYIRIHCMF